MNTPLSLVDPNGFKSDPDDPPGGGPHGPNIIYGDIFCTVDCPGDDLQAIEHNAPRLGMVTPSNETDQVEVQADFESILESLDTVITNIQEGAFVSVSFLDQVLNTGLLDYTNRAGEVLVAGIAVEKISRVATIAGRVVDVILIVDAVHKGDAEKTGERVGATIFTGAGSIIGVVLFPTGGEAGGGIIAGAVYEYCESCQHVFGKVGIATEKAIEDIPASVLHPLDFGSDLVEE